MSQDWQKRAFTSADEDGVLYLWLKSFAHSRYGRQRGAERVHTDAERAYWAEQAPVVEFLLRSATTALAVDPEKPHVIWGFVCTTGDIVHYMVAKHSVLRVMGREFTAEMMQDLLGGRLERQCGTTHELPWADCGLAMPQDAAGGGRMRARWHLDTTWLGRALLPKRTAA